MDTVIEILASTIMARLNCIASNNVERRDHHEATIERIAKQHLPSGSGFDNGTTVDLDDSIADFIVLNTSFHHMNENGYYDGWTEHKIVVTPSFIGRLTMKIGGRNRNDIKDYINDVFANHLLAPITKEQWARVCGVTATA